MQTVLSIQLPNKRGELSIQGVANFTTKEVMWQVCANGLPFCETPNWEDARAVWSDVIDLNNPALKENLQ